jgi:2-polyprenyl-3-methyl-5-hydroxy-6-metoxy-1,4-benzoquinol methylase
MATHSGYPLRWGPTNVDRYIGDPKRIAFFMARYKFAGKMMRDCESVLDVGCGDGMGTIGFLNETKAQSIVGVDFEPESINYAWNDMLPALRALRPNDAGRVEFFHSDFMEWAASQPFDGVVCLDVIEHIERAAAPAFIAKMADHLSGHGVCVVGTPSLAGEQFASVHSRAGHINLYDPARLHDELAKQFARVFMFSMNDEIVHTGFDKLAHYLMAVCVK